MPNNTSSWDPKWAENYGGTDEPERAGRADYLPATFVPRQNPFYVALPYNDVTKGEHKPEASQVIPWFKQAFQARRQDASAKAAGSPSASSDRVVYAQWEDCGPFRTDHWQYVFGNERPKPNLNKGAGLDVSPAVRDYLGMNDTDVTDWKFVDFSEVPHRPLGLHGDNNTFVQNQRAAGRPARLRRAHERDRHATTNALAVPDSRPERPQRSRVTRRRALHPGADSPRHGRRDFPADPVME